MSDTTFPQSTTVKHHKFETESTELEIKKIRLVGGMDNDTSIYYVSLSFMCR